MNCNVFPLFRGASRQRLKHQIDQQSTDRDDDRTSAYFNKEHPDTIRHAPLGPKRNNRKTENEPKSKGKTKQSSKTQNPQKKKHPELV